MLQLVNGARLILASSSPRRSELLRSLGLNFEIIPADIPEEQLEGEDHAAMVRRLARAKAGHVAARHPQAWVIGADTAVVIDDRVLGKPKDRTDAARMLSMIQGRRHVVAGGIAVINTHSGFSEVLSDETAVWICAMDAGGIEAYIDTGEPADKAGAYAIQGVGAHIVTRIEGSYTNVVGLNLAETVALLRTAGALTGAAV